MFTVITENQAERGISKHPRPPLGSRIRRGALVLSTAAALSLGTGIGAASAAEAGPTHAITSSHVTGSFFCPAWFYLFGFPIRIC